MVNRLYGLRSGGKTLDWLNFGEGVAAGGAIELVAAIGIFLATRYVTPTGPRTLTMTRGHHRAFIDRTINHRERWLWRVIDIYFHRLVASGEEESEQLAIDKAVTLLNRLAVEQPTQGRRYRDAGD
jgi:hypothetical protein